MTVEKGSATEDDDEDDEHDHSDETNVWLLTASIILAVALLFTLVSIFVRDLLKKRRAKKNFVKNVYAGKRKHYIRKLGLTESVVDENEAPAEGGEATEATEATPEENAPADDENTADEATEVPAEEASDAPDENKPEGENN